MTLAEEDKVAAQESSTSPSPPPEYELSPFCFFFPPDKKRPAQILLLEEHIRNVEQFARQCLAVDPSTDVHVEFLRPRYLDEFRPTNSKHTYKITALDKEYHLIIRPEAGHGHDIASQIATMDCLRRSTDVLRVPDIIAHDISDDDKSGRSWMMREYIPGEDMSCRWRRLSLEQKKSIAHDLARYLAQLYRIRFDKIGGLVYANPPTPTPAQHTSSSYLWSTLWSWLWTWLAWSCPVIADWVTSSALHTASPPPRKIVVGQDSTILSVGLYKGPFTNASDWFQARLLDIGLLQVGFAEEPKPHMPENKVNYIRETFKWIDFVRRRPSLSLDETVTTIFHPITAESIIISDEGKLAGLLDWDEVCACPLWAVTEVPDVILGADHETAVTPEGFIQSRQSTNREIPPEQHAAFVEAVAVSTDLDMRDCYFEYLLPDLPWQADCAIYSYWPQMRAFEKTQMRKVFHATMADLAPDWVDLRSSRQMDMAIAAGVDKMAWGSLVWFGQFEEEILGPLVSAAMSGVAWPSDDDTLYGSWDGDSDLEA